MSSRSPFIVLLALVAVPLATIKGSSKPNNNNLMQYGDKVQQEKVLQLLDQYVLHVDSGRADDHTETLDLLDQYVMHVDRGADLDLEASRGSTLAVDHQAGGQVRGPSNIVIHNSKDLTRQKNKKNLTQNLKSIKREKNAGDKLKNFRAIERVRRSLRGVEKSHKELIKPKNHLRSKHGVRAKRSQRKENSLMGETTFSDNRQRHEVRKQNRDDFTGLTSKSEHRSKRSVEEISKGMAEETETNSRQRRSAEGGNRISDSEEETETNFVSGPWTHTVQLDGSVTLSWKVMDGEDDIEFLVEAATRGYVGVGFSLGGGMAGADIILSWVDDNSGQIYVVVSVKPFV
jgi:hypothetical protein